MERQSERPAIRVVIVDDHPLLLQGTQALLERTPGIAVVGTAESGREALRLVASWHPDVMLLDIHLQDMSGVEVARGVSADFPGVAIVALTAYERAAYIRELVRLGARGFLGKTASAAEVVAAVRAAGVGQTVLGSKAIRAALAPDPDALTEPEQAVLGLLMAGSPNKEIARSLAVSLKTVEARLTHIFAKLGVRSRAEAIHAAHERGLVLDDRDASGGRLRH